MLGAQQSPQHGIGGDADPPQGWPLKLPSQVKHFDFQVLNLREEGRGGVSALQKMPLCVAGRC